MLVEAAERLFKLGDKILPDPEPTWSIEQVRKFYMDQYPQLATATLDEPVFDGNKITYAFTESVGQFG